MISPLSHWELFHSYYCFVFLICLSWLVVYVFYSIVRSVFTSHYSLMGQTFPLNSQIFKFLLFIPDDLWNCFEKILYHMVFQEYILALWLIALNLFSPHSAPSMFFSLWKSFYSSHNLLLFSCIALTQFF